MISPFKQKNILVIGGAGFIGSHLCDELIKDNRIICVDNFITGREENIDHLLKNPNFKFIKHDMVEVLDLEKLPELKPFDISVEGVKEVYNLACPTSPKEYNKFPIETLLANAYGTRNGLDLALKYKAKFLHFSTSAIYGEPQDNTSFPENYWGFINPIGPRSCYNEGKRFAESLVINYRNKYQLDAKIVRVFNTYGPRMKLNDGRMIPDFINSAISNEDLKIYGTGDEIGTYCYVSDLVEGLLKIMASDESGPINLGHPEVYLIKDIAQKIIELTASKSKIIYTKPLLYTARQGIPDISLAKQKLGWLPLMSLEEGLEKTIEFMKGARTLKINK